MIELLKYRTARVGETLIKQPREKLPYSLDIDPRGIRNVLDSSFRTGQKTIIVLDPKRTNNVGHMDSKSIFDPIKIRVYTNTIYRHYLTLKEKGGHDFAKAQAEQEVIRTIIHEQYHYIINFLNPAFFQFSLAADPGIAEFAKKMPAELASDMEEVFCEYMARKDAQKLASIPVSLNV